MGGDGAPRPSTEPPSVARGRPRRTPHSRPGASGRSSGAEAGEDGGGCSGECARPPRRRLGKRKPVVRSPARRRRRAGRPGSGRIAIRGIEEGGGVGPLGAGVPGTAVLVCTRAGGARGGGGPGARRGPARRTQWLWGGWARGRRPLPGAAGPGRGARRPCGQSFSRGRELKRLQNKAAAAHGAGRGPGGGAPTRNLRAGGRASGVGGRPRNFVRARAGAGPRGPRGSGATRALRVGFCVPPRGQLSLVRGGAPLAPPVSPTPARSRLAPATAWSRDGALAGERGAGGLGGLGRSGGPAAMFLLRGGPRRARRGRGTWRPLRAVRSRLFPTQASGRVRRARRTDPLPLGAPIGARAGHKGRPVCPEPRSARASPPLVAQPPRSGRAGGLGASGSDLPPPGGRAWTRWPPCATCAAAGPGSMSVAGTWQCGVFTPVRFSLDKLARRGKNQRGERAGGFCGTGSGGN